MTGRIGQTAPSRVGRSSASEGVARLTRGAPHHLATFHEALDVQEVVEAILAS